MVYYKISHVDGRITNPEQRIASDVPRFCSELSEIVQDDLTAVTDGLLYTWRLCSYASPKYIFWILVTLIKLYCITDFSLATTVHNFLSFWWLEPVWCNFKLSCCLFYNCCFLCRPMYSELGLLSETSLLHLVNLCPESRNWKEGIDSFTHG